MEVLYFETDLIECVAYEVRRYRMRITFANGRIVDFAEMPDTLFRAFAGSRTPDDFFRERIRGRFTWLEVGRSE